MKKLIRLLAMLSLALMMIAAGKPVTQEFLESKTWSGISDDVPVFVDFTPNHQMKMYLDYEKAIELYPEEYDFPMAETIYKQLQLEDVGTVFIDYELDGNQIILGHMELNIPEGYEEFIDEEAQEIVDLENLYDDEVNYIVLEDEQLVFYESQTDMENQQNPNIVFDPVEEIVEEPTSEVQEEISDLNSIIDLTFIVDQVEITFNDIFIDHSYETDSGKYYEHVLIVEYELKNNYDFEYYAGGDLELYIDSKKADAFIIENYSTIIESISANRSADISVAFGFNGEIGDRVFELELHDEYDYDSFPVVVRIPPADLAEY